MIPDGGATNDLRATFQPNDRAAKEMFRGRSGGRRNNVGSGRLDEGRTVDTASVLAVPVVLVVAVDLAVAIMLKLAAVVAYILVEARAVLRESGRLGSSGEGRLDASADARMEVAVVAAASQARLVVGIHALQEARSIVEVAFFRTLVPRDRQWTNAVDLVRGRQRSRWTNEVNLVRDGRCSNSGGCDTEDEQEGAQEAHLGRPAWSGQYCPRGL